MCIPTTCRLEVRDTEPLDVLVRNDECERDGAEGFVLLKNKAEVVRITSSGQTTDIGISDMVGAVEMLPRTKN